MKKVKKVVKKIKKVIKKVVKKKVKKVKKVVKVKLKKVVKKVVIRKVVKRKIVVSKCITCDTPVHNADYWLKRPLNDKHLDWNLAKNWIEDYWQSQSHPHRQLILNVLKELEFDSLLELGCNCGPNLALISKTFPGKRLLGIDIEPRVIERAKDEVRETHFQLGNITNLPWDTQSVDVVLADATFMYLDDEELRLALNEIERVVKGTVIVIDRFSPAKVKGRFVCEYQFYQRTYCMHWFGTIVSHADYPSQVH